MTPSSNTTEELVARAGAGDGEACQLLLTRHRERLRHMVAVRLDRRLLPRLDPSDVVQDALAEACAQLPDYLLERPLPFYPWLRQIAFDRLIALHRRHVRAGKRSVLREEVRGPARPDESVLQLAQRLVASNTSPSNRVLHDELVGRVQRALQQLAESDREVLVLRYLERLSVAETAAVLGISEGAIKVRHFRALQRLRGLLGAGEGSA